MKAKYSPGDVIAIKSDDAGTEFAKITAVMIKHSETGKTVIYEGVMGPDETTITVSETGISAAYKPYAGPRKRNRKTKAVAAKETFITQ